MSVHFDAVSFRYPSGGAGVSDIDLEIGDGELLAVIGPSGSGKTTLLQMVSGLTPATSGRLRIDGGDWTNRPVHERGMGLVFQHYALFPHMTVEENVAFPLKMRNQPADQIRTAVAETLAKVQLDAFAHRFPRELSGGQQQQLAIARALISRPRVLLLDEPTEGIQPNILDEIVETLHELRRQTGIAMILVEQNLEFLTALSDRLLIIQKGVITDEVSPELMADPERIADFVGMHA